MTTRTAIVKRGKGGHPDAAQVSRYLPSNYRVTGETPLAISIEGEDYAGWTLDEYVIPRLGSGLISAVETPRPIHQIADEIRYDAWKDVHPWAVPDLDAMRYLSDKDTRVGHDDAEGIVLRFLGNSKTWRGPDARRIKAELRQIIRK
jgi:hypothetical protein